MDNPARTAGSSEIRLHVRPGKAPYRTKAIKTMPVRVLRKISRISVNICHSEKVVQHVGVFIAVKTPQIHSC